MNRFTRGQVCGLPDKEFRCSSCSKCSSECSTLYEALLHVAMQKGPSLHPKHARMSDVWSLRIPLAFLRSAFPADCPHRMHCHY